MEHDQKVCPRCGKSADGFHFCPSCLAPVDSPAEISTHAATDADSGTAAATEVSATAVQVEADEVGPASPSEPLPNVARLEDVLSVDGPRAEPKPTAVSRLEISIRPDAQVSVPPPHIRVARLEEVLRVDPKDRIAARTAAAALPEVETAPPEPVAPETPKPEVDPATSVAPPSQDKPPVTPASYLPSYALRAAFLFEQSAAFKADDDDDEAIVEVPQPVVVEAPRADPEPQAVEEAPEQTSQSNWVVALCLLALIAMIVVLTGRRPSRCSGNAG
jgi:hypothetical protein